MKNEALSELLESLKDEVMNWELDENPLANVELIRRGLHLTAMDILLAELFEPGGYESYAKLPNRVLLPEADYRLVRRALDVYVQWFKSLNIPRLEGSLLGTQPITADNAENELVRELLSAYEDASASTGF